MSHSRRGLHNPGMAVGVGEDHQERSVGGSPRILPTVYGEAQLDCCCYRCNLVFDSPKEHQDHLNLDINHNICGKVLPFVTCGFDGESFSQLTAHWRQSGHYYSCPCGMGRFNTLYDLNVHSEACQYVAKAEQSLMKENTKTSEPSAASPKPAPDTVLAIQPLEESFPRIYEVTATRPASVPVELNVIEGQTVLVLAWGPIGWSLCETTTYPRVKGLVLQSHIKPSSLEDAPGPLNTIFGTPTGFMTPEEPTDEELALHRSMAAFDMPAISAPAATPRRSIKYTPAELRALRPAEGEVDKLPVSYLDIITNYHHDEPVYTFPRVQLPDPFGPTEYFRSPVMVTPQPSPASLRAWEVVYELDDGKLSCSLEDLRGAAALVEDEGAWAPNCLHPALLRFE